MSSDLLASWRETVAKTAVAVSRRLARSAALSVALCSCLALSAEASGPDGAELLRKMDELTRGSSNRMTVALDVRTKGWERRYRLTLWMKGIDLAFARIREPARSAGQGFLRIKTRLWNYLPTAERTVLVPASMMLDRFLGSDLTNDDLVKMSYFARDYDAVALGEGTVDGFTSYHLTLSPRPGAPVTYSRVELWLRVPDCAPVLMQAFDEKNGLRTTTRYRAFRRFGEREVPTVWEVVNEREPDRRTTFTIEEADFDLDIPNSVFTRANLERDR
jgi:outer membrane lipoprotein-sorting protein